MDQVSGNGRTRSTSCARPEIATTVLPSRGTTTVRSLIRPRNEVNEIRVVRWAAHGSGTRTCGEDQRKSLLLFASWCCGFQEAQIEALPQKHSQERASDGRMVDPDEIEGLRGMTPRYGNRPRAESVSRLVRTHAGASGRSEFSIKEARSPGRGPRSQLRYILTRAFMYTSRPLRH